MSLFDDKAKAAAADAPAKARGRATTTNDYELVEGTVIEVPGGEVYSAVVTNTDSSNEAHAKLMGRNAYGVNRSPWVNLPDTEAAETDVAAGTSALLSCVARTTEVGLFVESATDDQHARINAIINRQ